MRLGLSSVERKVFGGFFGALAVLGLLALATYLETTDFIARSRELSRMHEVLTKMDQIFVHVATAQKRQQAFIQSASKRDLDACQEALFAVDRLMGEIRALSARQKGQMQRLELLDPLLSAQVNLAKETVERRRLLGPAAAARHFKNHRAVQSLNSLSKLLQDFKDSESELMRGQNRDFEHKSGVILRFLALAVLLSIGIFVFVHRLIRAEMKRRQAAEQDLQNRSRLLVSVLDNIDDAIVACDAEGLLDVFNPAAERLFGHPTHQLTLEAQTDKGGLLKEDRSGPLPYDELPLVRASWGHDCEGLVLCYQRPTDGRYFYLSVTARGFRDADGVLSGAMAVYHDITELKNQQLALHGANAGLEERVNALKHAQMELQDVAVRDPLTGFYNRRQLERIFGEELERARRNGKPLGVLMTDIDHFKLFNDQYGHDAGDLVLKKVSETVHGSLRSLDSLFRYGGEEFTVLLPGASLTEAAAVAEKARRAVESLQLEHQGRPLGRLSISLGVASYPETGSKPDELLKQADEALYAAKEGGRNRSSVWGAKGRNAA